MAKETQLVNSGSFLEKRFHLKENHTNVRTEIIAGLTTFLTCTYILAVNPAILSSTGMDSKAVLWATAISAAIACIAMGLLTNFPFALAPAMGLNAYFAYTVCGTLGLKRVECVHARAEEFAAGHRESYDLAVSRAVAQLNVLCELALPLVKVGGQFLAMKSVGTEEEIAAAKGAIKTLGGKIVKVEDYTIPTSGVTHRAVVIEKVSPTPPRYPRAFAKIKKQPL